MKRTQRTEQQMARLSEAVRELREKLGESQQAFAYRMQTAVRTIARYETTRPPKGAALADLSRVADETGHPKLANLFRDSLVGDLGPIRKLTALGLLMHVVIPHAVEDLSVVLAGLKDEGTDPQARITEATAKLDALRSTLLKKTRPYNIYRSGEAE